MAIYRTREFNAAVNEYFDISDRQTFNYLRSIEEADQNKVLLALTSKLYDHMVDKVDDIDFGDIPKSRGDITKLPNYEKVVDCANIIKQILANSSQDTEPIDTIQNAIENLKNYKETFIKGFQLNMELPMVIYNTTVLSIYSGLSVLIASCIEFIKSTDNSGFDIALDKVQLRKTKDSLLFRDLKQLNASFENGSLPKALDTILRQNTKNFAVSTIVTAMAIGGAVLAVVLNIIPILRELTYFFYYTRVKAADYFDAQAALLQMNAYNLAAQAADSDRDVEQIQAKQLKIAGKFKKIANFLSIKTNKAEVAAEKETKQMEKKLKISDVEIEEPSDPTPGSQPSSSYGSSDDSIW